MVGPMALAAITTCLLQLVVNYFIHSYIASGLKEFVD
jgi:hypothetical protein